MKYAEWRACERFNVLPPGVKPKWDDMGKIAQCELLGYNQVREHEEHEERQAMMGARL